MSEQTPEFYITEQQAAAAIYEGATLTLTAKIGVGDSERELDLTIRWPDLDDESEMTLRAAQYLGGLSTDLVTGSDFNVARGRAVIETLAVAPYPAWITNGALSDKPVMHKGKTGFRPDTGKLRSRAVAAAIYSAYLDVYVKYQHLAAGV